MNLIMHTKLLPTDYLHHSNQARYIITSNAKNKSNELAQNKSNELAYLILVLIAVSRNEGSC